MSQKVEIDALKEHTGPSIAVFIAASSFESRCLTIVKALSDICEEFLFFSTKQASELCKANLKKMVALSDENSQTVELDLDVPTVTADAFLSVVDIIRKAAQGPVFVDITTFTHEHLLILLRVLSDAQLKRRFIFGYTGAEQYSVNTAASEAWLSKGVSQVRTVLGYPGEALPSKKQHLIILVGFEHDRAKAVIEQCEPSMLTLGIGSATQSISSAHYETNQRFFENVKDFVDEKTSIYSTVDIFEFSAIDPMATCETILERSRSFQHHNLVVCPMNTKLSTLGVGLAALENTKIQIIYSRVTTYNESGYSTPSKHATLFEKSF